MRKTRTSRSPEKGLYQADRVHHHGWCRARPNDDRDQHHHHDDHQHESVWGDDGHEPVVRVSFDFPVVRCRAQKHAMNNAVREWRMFLDFFIREIRILTDEFNQAYHCKVFSHFMNKEYA